MSRETSKQELQEVYRKRVLEHSRHPHNFGRPENTNRQAQGFNPLCGDKVTVFLRVENETIRALGFEGTGCAISIASASMMTDALSDLPVSQAAERVQQFHKMFDSDDVTVAEDTDEIQALAGVRKYPSRIKCATLAWSALETALNERENEVSTE